MGQGPQVTPAGAEAALQKVLNDIGNMRTDLDNLKQDFWRHDHGNTASYAQAAITIRATNNTFTNSPVSGAFSSRTCATSANLVLPQQVFGA